jgi:hypothetical protein
MAVDLGSKDGEGAREAAASVIDLLRTERNASDRDKIRL